MQQTYFSRSFTVSIEVTCEALVLVLAVVWMRLAQIDLLPTLILKDAWTIVLGAACGVSMSLSSFALTRLLSKYKDRFKYFSGFDELILTHQQARYKESTPLDIFLIAFSSGFCEEIFFRGVLQSQFGLLPAAVIFGVFHCGYYKALVAGLLFGVLLQISGGLWLPITAHVVNNLVKISMIRYQIGYKAST